MCFKLMHGTCSFNELTFYVQQEARNFANRILAIVTSFTDDALSAVSWPDLNISCKGIFQLFEFFYLSIKVSRRMIQRIDYFVYF